MSIEISVATIKEMKKKGAFKDYIDYIRFPFFRNLEPDTKIEFDFPLTIFVGQNGCGKSSTLQAIYGCPKGKSVSTYWFTTPIDQIKEIEGKERHCLIYSYSDAGLDHEVLKTRIYKVGQPELWDTSEPIVRYGMKVGNRIPPVEKEVVYVNFRAAQNAFEKSFHEERPPANGIQQHLRGRSWYLDRILNGKTIPHFQGKTHEPIVDLTPDELSEVGKILGRTYKKARLIKHRIFDHWGHSVILQTDHASYSEAFAGSGETAMVVLVREVLRSPKNSLLLLDEPETSLHPGAQTKLLEFLLNQCIKNQHQVVICTHAPALVGGLPRSAIKVFTPTVDGQFRVAKDVLPQEAFFFIGQPVPNKKTLIVEDRLAKALIDELLNRLGDATKNLFDTCYFPGGESQMKKDAVLHSRNHPSNTFLLFDGDQKPANPFFDVDTLPIGIDNDPEKAIKFLNAEIEKCMGGGISFPADGHGGVGNKPQQRDIRKTYLRYCQRNCLFLPMNIPEKEIWDDDCVGGFLKLIFSALEVEETKAKLAAEENYKAKFVVLTSALCGKNSGEHIGVFHAMLVKAWILRNSPTVGATVQILEDLKNLN